MNFQEVQYIGQKYVDHFEMKDKSIVGVETTYAKIEALKNVNTINPKNANGRWIYSGVDKVFNTKNGSLEVGQYAVVNGIFCGMMSTGKYEETGTLEELYARQELIYKQYA